MESIICISHSQDVDGLGSAALIKMVKKGKLGKKTGEGFNKNE